MIRQIVALDAKRGIAKNGVQPWDLPRDSAYFNEQTKLFGGVVLMGRKEFELMGKPLGNRTNYVLTHREINIPGVIAVHDLDQFLAGLKTDLWIMGGAEIYVQTLDVSDELYVTEIEADFGCDKFYPSYKDDFELVHESTPQQENGLTYYFRIYKPKPRAL